MVATEWQDVQGLAQSDFDRRLDDNQYWDLPVIMEHLGGGISLARRVLAERDAGFLRNHTYVIDRSAQWDLMIKAHSAGFTASSEPGKQIMTLEACMRHIYFEEITHLYNIQRLKGAQRLPAIVDLPRVGYWAVDGWDRSEP